MNGLESDGTGRHELALPLRIPKPGQGVLPNRE